MSCRSFLLVGRYLLLRPLLTILLLLGATLCRADQYRPQVVNDLNAISYTNCRIAAVPWSIHVVRMQRDNSLYKIDSVHAGAKAIGLETLSEQLGRLDSTRWIPVAGVNGDFYQRDKAFAGAPRGLQIMDGELISAPCSSATFWIDALGQFHMTNVASLFRIVWPNGATTGFGLNGELHPQGIELYTPTVGFSTHAEGAREFVLSRVEGSRWLPLRIGQTYLAHVSEVHEGRNRSIAPNSLVLSVGPAALSKLPAIEPGKLLRILTETAPPLHGVRTAISGGPILIQGGKRQKIRASAAEAYEFSSMLERHPRTAIGWNRNYFFLVEVDGRQKGLSVGMTLDELSKFLGDLGCEEAMNLDGGGSATLWYAGQVQNSPCDRMEREIANAMVIFKKSTGIGTGSAHN